MSVEVGIVDHRNLAVAARIVEVQGLAYAVEAELLGFDAIPPRTEDVVAVRNLDLTFLAAISGRTDPTGVPAETSRTVAEHIVALLGFRRDGHLVDIDRLAVEPTHFRTGLASALLDHLHASQRPAVFTVSTGAANEPATKLYASRGYTRTGSPTTADGLPLIRLRRRFS